jgi:hypothetical protein
LGFGEFPYNITKESTHDLAPTLRRVTPTNFIAAPLGAMKNKTVHY